MNIEAFLAVVSPLFAAVGRAWRPKGRGGTDAAHREVRACARGTDPCGGRLSVRVRFYLQAFLRHAPKINTLINRQHRMVFAIVEFEAT